MVLSSDTIPADSRPSYCFMYFYSDIPYQLHLNVFYWHTDCMVALLEFIVHETLFSCVWSLGLCIF